VTPEGKLDLHALRNAFVTLVMESGATWKETKHLARHQTLEMTDRYARSRHEQLRKHTESVGKVVLEQRPWCAFVETPKSAESTDGATAIAAMGCTERKVVRKGGLEPPRA